MPGRPLVCALALAALVAGCTHNVGDPCTQNVDCSPLGDRFCDLASYGGYCTIEGCDIRLDQSGNNTDSCPSESECVRFFTPDPKQPCDHPNRTCLATDKACCPVDARCLCDASDPSTPGTCAAGSAAHCAPETSERRWCMLRCSKDSDCRAPQYECRAPGTNGAELVPFLKTMSGAAPPANEPSSFCVEKQAM